MPQHTRNFWIDLDVDGRKNSIGTGPRSKDGGFEMTILMREDGDISDKRVRIVGTSSMDGENNILVEVIDSTGINVVSGIKAQR